MGSSSAPDTLVRVSSEGTFERCIDDCVPDSSLAVVFVRFRGGIAGIAVSVAVAGGCASLRSAAAGADSCACGAEEASDGRGAGGGESDCGGCCCGVAGCGLGPVSGSACGREASVVEALANALFGTVAIGAVGIEGFAESDSSDAELSTAGDVEAAGTACDCGCVSADM